LMVGKFANQNLLINQPSKIPPKAGCKEA